VDTGTRGCGSCHYYDGAAAPGGAEAGYKFGPDFAIMAGRLRPRWMYAWQADPSLIYPGTTMTAYTWDDRDADRNEDRRRATIEFIHNFRRFVPQK
jgi:hypothetical protein